MAVQFGVLGSLETPPDHEPRRVTSRLQRALLALLLLNANRAVSSDRAIGALWGDDAPVSARAQVHSLVHALRRKLASTADEITIEKRPEGYALVIERDDLDLILFDEGVTAARTAAADGRLDDAARRFREALSLWRGPALEGIDAPFAAIEACRLEELRLVAIEDRSRPSSRWAVIRR